MWFFNKKQKGEEIPKKATPRPLRKFKNFQISPDDERDVLMTRPQYLAFLIVKEAIVNNAHKGGGFTWDDIALEALDVLIEHGYLDGLKNPPKIEESNNPTQPEE